MANLVSIIIPCYNKAEYLGETLQSVLNQTYTNWECILVNDGSTDDTENVAKFYFEKDIRFHYFLNKNQGVCFARNFGIKRAKGDFVIFLDADDLLADFSVAKRVEYFNNYPEQDGLVFTTQFFEKNTDTLLELFNNNPEVESEENYLKLFLNYHFPFTVMSPIWRRSILEKVMFKEELRLLEDVVFHIEILFLEHIKIKRIYLVDNYYRRPPLEKLSSSGRSKELIKSTLYILKTYNRKICKDVFLKQNFSRFVKIIYRIVVLNQVKSKNQKEVYNIAKKFKYITLEEQFLFSILSVIYKIKLNEKRNIGMYQIVKYIDKILLK